MENGAFIGLSGVLDPSQIRSMNINSEEFKELVIRLQQQMNNISILLNMKTTGSYVLGEFVNGNTFFPNPAYSSGGDVNPIPRPEYGTVINFGALPVTTTKSVAHGLTFNSSTIFTRMTIASSDTTNKKYINIPYASSTTADIVESNVDNTNVNIKTGKDMSAYNHTIVILYYIKV